MSEDLIYLIPTNYLISCVLNIVGPSVKVIVFNGSDTVFIVKYDIVGNVSFSPFNIREEKESFIKESGNCEKMSAIEFKSKTKICAELLYKKK